MISLCLQAFVESNPSIKWCPYPGCGRAVKLPGADNPLSPRGMHDSQQQDYSHAVDCGNGHTFCWWAENFFFIYTTNQYNDYINSLSYKSCSLCFLSPALELKFRWEVFDLSVYHPASAAAAYPSKYQMYWIHTVYMISLIYLIYVSLQPINKCGFMF